METELDKIKEIVEDAVLKFKRDKISLMREKLLHQLQEALKAGNNELAYTLQKKDAALANAVMRISKNLGNRII